jgi:hypothetical protein
MTVNFCWLLALLLAGPAPASKAGEPEGLAAGFDPGLVDVNELDIVVEVRRHPTIGPNDPGFSSHLEKLIRTRLETSGIPVFDHNTDTVGLAMRRVLGRRLDVDPNTLRWRPADVPILRAAVDIILREPDAPVVLCAYTFFARLVCLDGRKGPSFRGTVWSTDPAVECVQSSRWQGEAERMVLEQVGSFIAARKAAAPHDGEAQVVSSVPALPRSAGGASPYTFVASKSGQVFHRPDCKWARNISSDNRLDYNTREEALEAGKRPCKTCKP